MNFAGTLSEARDQGYFIIDIRRPEECSQRPLPEADEEIEMNVLMASPTEFLPEGRKVLLVCKAGTRAGQTTTYLRSQGFYNVYAYPKAW